ncbi:MAG TPA: pseudouridine synthase [Thiothrix sp.]|nr:pseudouridine synthase [Thiothrix sp.]
MAKLVLFNKPYLVLSQFRANEHTEQTIADYVKIPKVYPAGRLDKDSEGLLLLTDDGQWQHKIAHPTQKMSKTYWVQVEGLPQEKDLQRLREGIELKDGMTLPAKVQHMDEPLGLWARQPPIRQRQQIPDCWLSVTIQEGRNRQVRRMTAAMGYPTLRLIRYRIGSWTLDGLDTGDSRVLELPQLARVQSPKTQKKRMIKQPFALTHPTNKRTKRKKPTPR